MYRAFSPRMSMGLETWGVAPGWYESRLQRWPRGCSWLQLWPRVALGFGAGHEVAVGFSAGPEVALNSGWLAAKLPTEGGE
jgi:hypothetical protein